MASDLKLGTPARNAVLNAIGDLLDDRPTTTKIDFYTGSPPASLGDAATGTLLWTCTFLDTDVRWLDSPTAGVADCQGALPLISAVTASGTVGYFRVRAAGAAELQGTCGDSGDAPVDIEFNNKSLVSGGTGTLNTLVLTMPE